MSARRKQPAAGAVATAEPVAPMRLAYEVVDLPVSRLSRHPRNRKGDEDADPEIAALAASIASQGLLHPLTVAPMEQEGHYVVLAGHRRLLALRSLHVETVPCRVLVNGAERALEIQETENAQRRPISLLEESDLVREMLERPNWVAADVAAALGRPLGWVERRANLGNLAAPVRVGIEQGVAPLHLWPPAWVELLATLPHERQVAIALAETGAPSSLAELREEVALSMRSLGGARWALDDASLVPDAGACTGCPKHSFARPSLFECDAPKDIAGATCADAACYEAKATAWLSRRVDDLRKSGLDGKVYVAVTGTESRVAKLAAKDAKAPTIQVHPGRGGQIGSEKPKAGTVAAVLPDGEVRYVPRPLPPTGPKKAPKGEPPAKSPAKLEQEAQLLAQRATFRSAAALLARTGFELADRAAKGLAWEPDSYRRNLGWVYRERKARGDRVDVKPLADAAIASPWTDLQIVCAWGVSILDPVPVSVSERGRGRGKKQPTDADVRRNLLEVVTDDLARRHLHVEVLETLSAESVNLLRDGGKDFYPLEPDVEEARLLARAMGLDWDAIVAALPPEQPTAPAKAKGGKRRGRK